MQKNGNWSDKYTWNSEGVPKKEDNVIITNYNVALQTKNIANSVTLQETDNLTTDSSQ